MPAEGPTTYTNEVLAGGEYQSPGAVSTVPAGRRPCKWQPSVFITITVTTHVKQPDADREYVQINCVPTARKGGWEKEWSEVGGLDGERLPERQESELGFY